jgi:hypothetical protein
MTYRTGTYRRYVPYRTTGPLLRGRYGTRYAGTLGGKDWPTGEPLRSRPPGSPGYRRDLDPPTGAGAPDGVTPGEGAVTSSLVVRRSVRKPASDAGF